MHYDNTPEGDCQGYKGEMSPAVVHANSVIYLTPFRAVMMDKIAWGTVAEYFIFDGSWLDIYVFNTNIDDWQRVLDQLRHAQYDLVYHRNGNPCELPQNATDAFPAPEMHDRLLCVQFAEIVANCHFFAPDEIEFDIDPGQVQGQRQLDALLAFMKLLSDATSKESVLTPENFPTNVLLRSHL
ncbi:MAG TPA: hypothetical protein VFE58_03850 [Tepidisphaeraceae bacterium]|jgi:hypothetical protein|nr:hypothetical protein [Tepidisphaeraceae bacterium]